ncbi:tetratricopeptide repeat protein [Desulfobulbus elongatus]|uniref:tetratricopeptide repeat protein n=1 Tax=Desulfobulbus elongatus TaxID=53332 RepID=UPI00047FD670|nr:tetratricopeptide repeat protein [Desulfobulbus elongatus]
MRWTGQPAGAGIVALLLLILTGCAATGRNSSGDLPPQPPALEETTKEDLKPPDPNHLALARDLVRQRHFEVALVQLQAVAELSADKPEAHYLMGVCYRETNRPAEAEQSFLRVLKLDGDHASAYNGLGLVYQQQDRRQEAIDAFRKAITLDPARADFLNNLGYALLKNRQYDEAWDALSKSLFRDPAYQTARNNLALCALYRNKDEEALRLLLDGHSEWAAYHNMAVLYRMAGRPDKAVVMERKAAALRSAPPAQGRRTSIPGSGQTPPTADSATP